MKSHCPKCLSRDIYRKMPLDLTVYCAKCGFHWTVNQVLKPFLIKEIYRGKAPKGKHTISVWCCPSDPNKFSFAIAYGSGITAFEEFASDPYLSGVYNTAEEALKAGVGKAYE